MPSVASFFHRHHGAKSTHSCPNTAETSRLKKWARFLASDAGEIAFCDNTPKPSGASTTNVPELPSLPIYHTYTSGRQLSLLADDRPRDGKQHGDRKLPRFASIADFQDLGHPRRLTLGRHVVSAPGTDKPPAYDRAAELARFYQSILPDFDAVWDDDDNRNSQQQRRPQGQPTIRSDNTLPHGVTKEASEEQGGQRSARLEPPQNPRRNTSPVAPSTTAIDSNTEQREVNPRPQRSSNTWPLSALTPVPEPAPEPAPETTTAPGGPRDRRSRISQHSSVGLQICTELLTAQLIKGLSLQQQESGDDETGEEMSRKEKKLQVLLLIEAYESVLRSCRREMGPELGSETTAGRDPVRDERRRNVGEAVPILDHWLNSLHAVYDDSFAEDGAG
ncbi:hypothetical protein C8A00DRAFT_19252 [Chaetomidium leptoderma]|uniref:Uncharacterized protein n=1 Tax=Chaetomidium leptoderma TaxID=669021 RepID=A0AAN6ZRE1_9PEZI|nr:hypothetical protein C8A00DRAFT_19252 [Chaetomidium leptoderma]